MLKHIEKTDFLGTQKSFDGIYAIKYSSVVSIKIRLDQQTFYLMKPNLMFHWDNKILLHKYQ